MIKVNNSTEFKRLIGALSDDIVSASIHWQLQRDLREAMPTYPLVAQQSNTFWHLTLKAHVNAAIQHLCRAFDQEQKSLHLLSWLLTIRDNLHLFSYDEFKKRLATNAFAESLAEGGTTPDQAQLGEDIELCRDTDPLVKKLISFRGNNLAHRSAKLARGGRGMPHTMVLSIEEFEELLRRARVILNRYTRLFAAESYSTRIIGARDFEYIFKTIQADVEASRARTDALLTASAEDKAKK